MILGLRLSPYYRGQWGGNQEVTDKVAKPNNTERRAKQEIWDEIRSTEVEYNDKIEFCQDEEESIRLVRERDSIIMALYNEINELDSAGFSGKIKENTEN